MEHKKGQTILKFFQKLRILIAIIFWAIIMFSPDHIISSLQFRIAFVGYLLFSILCSKLFNKYLPHQTVSKFQKVTVMIMICLIIFRTFISI